MDEHDQKRIPLIIISSTVIDAYFTSFFSFSLCLFVSLQNKTYPLYRKVIYSIGATPTTAQCHSPHFVIHEIHLFILFISSTNACVCHSWRFLFILSGVFLVCSKCLLLVNKHNSYFVFASSF